MKEHKILEQKLSQQVNLLVVSNLVKTYATTQYLSYQLYIN